MAERQIRDLGQGWEAAATAPDACSDPNGLGGLDWLPARVPGTAAGALRDARRWRVGEPFDFDAQDWWFRARFDAMPAQEGEEVVLGLDGIATVAEVFLNGESILESQSMFERHSIDVGGRLLGTANEVAIRCRALGPLLQVRRRPRARWRTQIVAEGNLRFFRTALLGRAPGFAPGPAPVGPWRPVRLERRNGTVLDELRLRPRLEGDDGALELMARLRALDGTAPDPVELELNGPSGTHRTELTVGPGGVCRGSLRVPGVARWWPHTHGTPVLHDVSMSVAGPGGREELASRRVGFRTLLPGSEPDHDVEAEGLDPHCNGVRIFARGAVWTPVDAVGLAPEPAVLRAAVQDARDAGMNVLRVPGIGAYEADAFYDLCDELGLLVWQDFMLANFDYPLEDDGFRALIEREARDQLARVAGRPSLAVLCGGSEVEQQAAMLGLHPALGRSALHRELLPAIVREAEADVAYVPSAPCGGDLPFRPDRGVVNYFGVGAYLRPLDDARRAGVRFASECLAFANLPDEDVPDRVPRDSGADWDFADVRDHYLALVYGVDANELKRADPERHRELGRLVTGEVMAEVFGEWRRSQSRCGGGLVLWLRDLAPGAGWGVLDHRGLPKAAFHHLRRALAPVAVWTVDEGLNGIDVHVANDGSRPLGARLRIALYREGKQRLEEVSEELELAPHGSAVRGVEAMLGRFVDPSWAYRFGPPAQDVIVASLEGEGESGANPISQAFRFPAGRPVARRPPEELGLEAHAQALPGGRVRLAVRSRRLAYGVRIHVPDARPSDDAFHVEPGGERVVDLAPVGTGPTPTGGTLTAVNLQGAVPFVTATGTGP